MRRTPPGVGLRPGRRGPACLALCVLAGLSLGCELQRKPVLRAVEYRSEVACAATPGVCPWSTLEEQAKLAARVNCLLAGSTVILSDRPGLSTGERGDIVVARAPRYGYERMVETGDGRSCPQSESICLVASRPEWKVTWASCVAQNLDQDPLRGGEDAGTADPLIDSEVLLGDLSGARDDFSPPGGLDGPDHFYTFTLSKQARVEVAVGANTSSWPDVRGPHSPWQPALYLLSADRARLSEGYVWRAGVATLFPMDMKPGTYYIVVDSSEKEYARGDGLYHLYLGLNGQHLGPLLSKKIPLPTTE